MTVKEIIDELKKFPGDLKVCFDTEGNHQSCFVDVDYVFGEYCIKHGFIGMGTAASHSKVTGESLRHQRIGDPKDFPCILSDRDISRGRL